MPNKSSNNRTFQRRAFHHDYTRPARYLITVTKSPVLSALSVIEGDPAHPQSVHVRLTKTGICVENALHRWSVRFPQIDISAYVIMPDHIHLCLNVKHALPNGLSRAIGSIKGLTSLEYHDTKPDDRRPATVEPVFAKGFNDRIAYTDEQWKRQIYYTLDNPRRYLLKRKNPDYLLRRWHQVIDGNKYILRGNIFYFANRICLSSNSAANGQNRNRNFINGNGFMSSKTAAFRYPRTSIPPREP